MTQTQFGLWLNRFLDSYYRHRPVNATFIGVHDYDHLLPDLSPDGVDACVSDMTRLQNDLSALPSETLTESQRTDRQLASNFLEIQQWEFQSTHFHRGNPSFYVSEAIFGVLSLFRRDFAPFNERLEAAIQRMNAIDTLLTQARENIEAAPSAWIERAVNECEGSLSFLESGLQHLLHDNTESNEAEAAASSAADAFRTFKHWLQSELPANDAYGSGPDAFNMMLQKGHCLNMTADDVEAYAWEHLHESVAMLEAGTSDFDASDWQEALTKLQNHYPTPDPFFPHHYGLWRACRFMSEENNLVTWPDCDIQFIPRPLWARGCAPKLYFLPYHSAPAFDHIPAVDCILPPIDWTVPAAQRLQMLKAANNSVIKLNHVVHHAALGHHVQNWYAYNKAQSRIGQIAAVDVASRLAFFCAGALAEGWATYSVSLMDEVNFLTALESYSLHHARLRACARAIVDVGIHTGKMTLEDAQNFYADKVGMSAAASRAEAVKNTMFPGAAMMYLIGSDAIVNLRSEMQSKHGDRFNLKRFHDALLSHGSIPVPLIANSMRRNDNWLSP